MIARCAPSASVAPRRRSSLRPTVARSRARRPPRSRTRRLNRRAENWRSTASGPIRRLAFSQRSRRRHHHRRGIRRRGRLRRRRRRARRRRRTRRLTRLLLRRIRLRRRRSNLFKN
jgi:hypothetical protein